MQQTNDGSVTAEEIYFKIKKAEELAYQNNDIILQKMILRNTRFFPVSLVEEKWVRREEIDKLKMDDDFREWYKDIMGTDDILSQIIDKVLSLSKEQRREKE